jgi:hypothetical protein
MLAPLEQEHDAFFDPMDANDCSTSVYIAPLAFSIDTQV